MSKLKPVKTKKKKKTPVIELSTARAHAAERNMPVYFRRTNWANLWEDWYNSLNADGGYKYRRIYDFVKARADSVEQRKFMTWYLGPKSTEGDDAESPYSWCKEGPQGWFEKRKSGGWFTDKNIKVIGTEIRRRLTALDALREAGNSVTLNSLVRAEQLAQELDRSFHGQMFLDDLSFRENLARAEAYVALHGQILTMKGKAQEMYARSHGVNFDDMGGLAALMQAAAVNGMTSDQADSRGKAALSAVVEMAIRKGQRYDLELPPGAVEVMAEATAKADRKKGVQ